MAHIQTQAAQQRYIDYGITEVEVPEDEDERRCEVCGKLHGKRFKITETMPVPAHPRCRCCIVPVIESTDLTKGKENTIINKDDIYFPRSVGAKGRNYPVKDIQGSNQHFKFAEGTSLTDVKVIMGKGTNKPLNDRFSIAMRNGISNPDDI